jgi:hypothetical protein
MKQGRNHCVNFPITFPSGPDSIRLPQGTSVTDNCGKYGHDLVVDDDWSIVYWIPLDISNKFRSFSLDVVFLL